MKIISFDIETSNVFDLRPGEDIDKYAPFDVAVAATQIHGGEHRLWFSRDEEGRTRDHHDLANSTTWIQIGRHATWVCGQADVGE